MNKLVVNPGRPNAWEIQLKPGTNLLGRGAASDFAINDASVSSSHCQIILSDTGAVIKDLGSTNGTFINHAPVQMAALQPGQRIHLGSVEMLFESDTPVAAPAIPKVVAVAIAKAPDAQSAPPKAVPVVARLSISKPQPEAAAAAPPPLAPAAELAVTHAESDEAVDATPPVARVDVGEAFCKSHIKTPATYYCGHCAHYYCDLCVSTRPTAGVMKKNCRKCGAECTPVHVHIQSLASPQGFFARLPGAFVYPFRGSGFLVLIVATLIFAALDAAAGFLGFLLGLFIMVVLVSYLFSYMQNIIHSTAAEDTEMPELPGMDGLFGAFCNLVGTVLISFGPAIVCAYFAIAQQQPAAGVALIPAYMLGCLYFPMAFLAVAMKDTVLAANPLVVVPAILKVPAEYIVATLLVIGVSGIRQLADNIMAGAAAVSHSTRSMAVLFTTFGIRALFSLVNVYLLTVSMRILGLLYVSKKEKLGWF